MASADATVRGSLSSSVSVGKNKDSLPTPHEVMVHQMSECTHLIEATRSFTLSDRDDMVRFLMEHQGHSKREALELIPSLMERPLSYGQLFSYLMSEHGDLQRPIPTSDLTQHLSHYFISSSHNTYLTGNQLYSESSVDEYKNVLLRGCRCVEVDVWDGVAETSGDERPKANERRGFADRLLSKRSSVSPASVNESSASAGGDAPVKDKSKRLSHFLRSKLGMHPKVEHVKHQTPATPVDDEDLPPPAPWRANDDPVIEPRVLHGYTLTKQVSFRAVCQAIKDTAFVTSDLPIIVSLEVHCNHEQQEQMVKIIKELWGPYLAMLPVHAYDDPDRLALPSPLDLRKRILIKVKYTPPERAAAKAKQDAEHSIFHKPSSGAPQPDPSSESEDEGNASETPSDAQKKKKPKMISALSELGIYTRAYHFKSFSNPEALIPTHVFSLSEGALFSLSANDPGPLFHHNAGYLMRCYPKGTRIRSTNLTPTPFWRAGVQMVALNWQNLDKANMLNEGMFAHSHGWVLKPETHRLNTKGKKHGWLHFGKAAAQHAVAKGEAPPTATENPAANSTAGGDFSDESVTTKLITLTLNLVCAQNLPIPPDTKSSSFRPYFKVSLHTEGLTPAADFHEIQKLRSTPSQVSRSGSASLHPSSAEEGNGSSSPPLGMIRTASIKRKGSVHRSGSISRSGSLRNHRRRSSSSVQKSGQAAKLKMKVRTSTWSAHRPPQESQHGGRPPADDPQNPYLHNQEIKFEEVEVDDESLCFLRVKLMDDIEMARDAMSGWACIRLDRIGMGLRMLKVLGRDGMDSGGRVLVNVSLDRRVVEVGSGKVLEAPEVS